jgi:hypothetical protein
MPHVSGDLVELYKRRAHRLRAETYRSLWLTIWSALRFNN